MALANNALNVYGKVEAFFKTIQEGQAPEKFTTQHLKDIGYASTNFRAFIPLMKSLGFLSEDGIPTQRYHDYRNNVLAPKIMGKAIKEAYSDLFVIKAYPTTQDEELFQGKFKSKFNTSDANAKKMVKTFFALLAIADINGVGESVIKEQKEKTVTKDKKKEPVLNDKTEIDMTQKEQSVSKESKTIKYPSLNYNIQVHLPATKDVEVYNAIFKSLKEHLID